jgi:hypothetical protein
MEDVKDDTKVIQVNDTDIFNLSDFMRLLNKIMESLDPDNPWGLTELDPIKVFIKAILREFNDCKKSGLYLSFSHFVIFCDNFSKILSSNFYNFSDLIKKLQEYFKDFKDHSNIYSIISKFKKSKKSKNKSKKKLNNKSNNKSKKKSKR